VADIFNCEIHESHERKSLMVGTVHPAIHEPGRLLSPSLSSIPNGGEVAARPGEEALRSRDPSANVRFGKIPPLPCR